MVTPSLALDFTTAFLDSCVTFTCTTDATDQSATSPVLGQGTAAKVFYYKQALLAVELAALVN